MYETFIFATRIVEVIFDKLTLQFIIGVYVIIFVHDATAPGGPGLPHYRDFTITLRHTTLRHTTLRHTTLRHTTLRHTTLRHTTLSRTPLDDGQPDAEASSWQHTTITRHRHPCPGKIRTHNPSERPQTHALDRSTTGIGLYVMLLTKIK